MLDHQFFAPAISCPRYAFRWCVLLMMSRQNFVNGSDNSPRFRLGWGCSFSARCLLCQVELVGYCRALDAAQLAGDSAGDSFDAIVIRRLMSAKLPVQQVILEDLNHVAEKYRALRCAFEDV
jgi:hypothetical protein